MPFTHEGRRADRHRRGHRRDADRRHRPTSTATTRVRREEFEKLPVGRSYQALIGDRRRGVVGTGNVNALGALTSNNLFIIDAVDTTDPTTGTFGTNLNFEAIQEVSVYDLGGVGASTAAPRARSSTSITKSGTNRFEGSAKYIFHERQLGRAEHDRQRDHRRVARARQVRQGQPGLHVHRRRADLARTAPGSSAPTSTRTTPRRSGRRRARSRRTTSRPPRTSSSTSAARVQLAEGQTGVGQVLPVADRRLRHRLLGRHHAGRRARGADRAEPDRARTGRRSGAACSRATGRWKRRLRTYALDSST